MNISTLKTEKGDVTCETPEGTVVHININQRSAFDCLLDTFRFFKDLKKSGQKTKPARMVGSAAHLGFGVAYISLGLVSVMLAIIIVVAEPDMTIFFSGLHFWVGFPFIVSGILNLVAYKFPKVCWLVLAFISLLVNFGVSIAGMVLAGNDISRLRWIGPNGQVCDELQNSRRGYYDRTTNPPRYYNDYYNDYYLQRCKSDSRQQKILLSGLTIMTLLITIWGLCLAILSVGYRVKSFCCPCKLERTEEKDEAPLKPNIPDDLIIA